MGSGFTQFLFDSEKSLSWGWVLSTGPFLYTAKTEILPWDNLKIINFKFSLIYKK